MFTLDDVWTYEQHIKKSRFVAFAGPVTSEVTARTFLASRSDPSANHNCWAWRIGQTYRFSDDGEPSGIAGRPILQAIDGQSLDAVAVVVTRWFGGVLLGSGGLIRAYGGTAAACLRASRKIEIVPRVEARITTAFSDLPIIKARLAGFPGARIDGENFIATGAELDVALPQEHEAEILRMIIDITSGRVVISRPD